MQTPLEASCSRMLSPREEGEVVVVKVLQWQHTREREQVPILERRCVREREGGRETDSKEGGERERRERRLGGKREGKRESAKDRAACAGHEKPV